MEWRCEWCGKPHDEDDPPCDNCGHGGFERAVVPTAPEGDGEGGPLVWVCTECGREHPRNNPPCSRCGGMPLEKQRQSFDEDDPLPDDDDQSAAELWSADDEPGVAEGTMTVWACADCGRAHPRNNPPCSRCGGMTFEREERVFDPDDDWDEPVSTGPDPEAGSDTMTAWVCTECGRSHPRNNPPCSRCGSMSLEQREERFDDLGAGGGGWRSAVDWKVGLGFVGALVLLTLIVGPAMGVFDLPGEGPPAVEGVPGEADTHGGVALSAVERSFVDQLATSSGGDLSWNRELAGVATYRNRWTVKTTYTDAERPTPRPLLEAVSNVDSCAAEDVSLVEFDTPATLEGTSTDGFGSADAMAAALVTYYAGEDGAVDVAAPAGQAAADVHVGPDGRVFVTVFFC